MSKMIKKITLILHTQFENVIQEVVLNTNMPNDLHLYQCNIRQKVW